MTKSVATLRLTQITFRAGAATGAVPLQITPGNVTVLVGPNNSGKSLALQEIEQMCLVTPASDNAPKVIEAIGVDLPGEIDDVIARLQPFGDPETPPLDLFGNEQMAITYPNILNVGAALTMITPRSNIAATILNSPDDLELRSLLLKGYTIRLDGRTRFDLVAGQPLGDLRRVPQNHLSALYRDDHARQRLQAITEDVFGRYFLIDGTDPQHLQIRLGKEPPPSTELEHSLTAEAISFYDRADLLTNFGDGIQAFVGLLSAVMSLPHTIILLDEPETFLHPPLARRLGLELTRIARDRNASLVVATHDADFLMGCLDEPRGTSIARLTYEDGKATTRALDSAELTLMMRHPLFRSTGVLRALFHRGAVITEADADRVFYDEINQRLLGDKRGTKDVLFLNAQNWQTEPELVRPLRRIGIPAVAIVDFHTLFETDMPKLINACNVEESERLYHERDSIWKTIASLGHDKKAVKKAVKAQGVSLLDKTDQARLEALLEQLGHYGLFLVPNGELESWLKNLGITGHTPGWLITMFSRIAELDGTPNAVRPASDDVWVFLDHVARWIDNPSRRGMGS